jgi:hypothetical protein
MCSFSFVPTLRTAVNFQQVRQQATDVPSFLVILKPPSMLTPIGEKALFAGLCGPRVSTHNVLVLLIIRGVAWEVVDFLLPCSVSRYRVIIVVPTRLHMLDTRPLE